MKRTGNGLWPEVEQLAWTVRIQMFVVIMGGLFSPSFFHFPHMMTFVAITALYRAVDETVPANAAEGYYGYEGSEAAYNPAVPKTVSV